ncbi:MAG: Hsp20/alpha crystallin family protein [Deltaproteobacteria bacterium]|nr:MAG: Hsp20/alpha crystallin family protein [Deltaproteobacteria bacterium]
MGEVSRKTLKPRDKTQLNTKIEQTKPGKVFIPDVDIYETEKEIRLIADMPGVTADKVNINLKDNILTLDGEVETLEGRDETPIFKEFETGRYYRQFSLSHVIDQSKIEAELKDGVLKLTLPKIETKTPRKIEVKAE